MNAQQKYKHEQIQKKGRETWQQTLKKMQKKKKQRLIWRALRKSNSEIKIRHMLGSSKIHSSLLTRSPVCLSVGCADTLWCHFGPINLKSKPTRMQRLKWVAQPHLWLAGGGRAGAERSLVVVRLSFTPLIWDSMLPPPSPPSSIGVSCSWFWFWFWPWLKAGGAWGW